MSRITDTTSPRSGGGLHRPPSECVGEIAEQPRLTKAAAADDDPVAPVCRIISRPSSAPQMSPFPSTGTVVHRLQFRDRGPVGRAGVELSAVRACSATAAAPSSAAIRPASR